MINHACTLWAFNPTAEMELANGSATYQAPKHLLDFERALEPILGFMASASDFVAVQQHWPAEFREFWLQHGVELPRTLLSANELPPNIVLDAIEPWGWSAAMHRRMEPYKAHCGGDFRLSARANWREDFKAFYGRATALSLYHNVLAQATRLRLPAQELCPKQCTSVAEVELALSLWPQAVLKAPWSSSGRGVQLLRSGRFDTSRRQWTETILAQQGYIMVEPLHDKIMDFAMQFELRDGSAHWWSYSFFETNSNGSYQGNLLGRMPNLPSDALLAWEAQHVALRNAVARAIEAHPLAWFYEGWLGVDALLYRTPDGKVAFHPVVELNLRQNMGMLAGMLEYRMAIGAKGRYAVYYNKQTGFAQFAREQQQKHPAVSSVRGWQKGFFPLTFADGPFGAYMLLD